MITIQTEGGGVKVYDKLRVWMMYQLTGSTSCMSIRQSERVDCCAVKVERSPSKTHLSRRQLRIL